MKKTREELIKAQEELCKKFDYPMFVPGDGICWHCKLDMVDERWENEHQTGCRRCSRTYCD